MTLSDAVSHLRAGLLGTLFGCLVLVGALYALYQRLLPQPIPGIPYNKESARKLLGDAPDMLKEVGATRELNVWLVKQVNKLQAPVVSGVC